MKTTLLLIIGLFLLFTATPSPAQTQATAAGQWEGSINAQGNRIEITVYLVRDDKGPWKGLIAIPAQQLNAYPLSNVKIEGAGVAFEMSSVQGLPVFKGKVSADGKTITGEVTQSGASFPFNLERKGEAKIAATDLGISIKSTTNYEGSWQGIVDAGGNKLTLILKIAKAADGSFTAFLDSPDQGAQNLPINSLTATDSALSFEMKYIGASFQGTPSKDGSEIVGTWSQGGSAPLTLKRQAK